MRRQSPQQGDVGRTLPRKLSTEAKERQREKLWQLWQLLIQRVSDG
jgi:hypothetical protein